MRVKPKSVHRIIAATLLLAVSGFCTLAFAHSGGGGGGGSGHGGGHGHGGHRGATHRNGDLNSSSYGSGRDDDGGYGWYTGRFYGAGRLGYGIAFETLPWYCETYQWGGVAYYYADDNYYQWNSSVGAYETVQPPPGLVDQVQAQAQEPAMRELFIFTEAGQSNEQLARDREDCQRLAAKQVGFDPRMWSAGSVGTPATNLSSADVTAAMREDYLRADGACLMARNYSVE
jgi:hypothetical protein